MKSRKSYGKENDLNLKTLIALSRSVQTVRRGELKTIQAGGLTSSQFGVLEILYHKGDLRICEIIEGTLSTGGNMTLVIRNLEKEGCISRYPHPQDGRASLIRITEKGRKLMDDIFPEHVRNISRMFGVLSEAEKHELIELLKKLSEGIQGAERKKYGISYLANVHEQDL